MDVRFRPYTWVGERTPPSKKRRAPYSTSWSGTLQKLEGELRKLRASEIIIEAGFSEDDIRLDGWPRANAKPPPYPGVKVSFNQPGIGRVEYPCDSCQHWQDNIHSIALGLEALRAVERYGITGRMQQYTGFRALGAGGNGKMTKHQAAEFIAKAADVVPVTDAVLLRIQNEANAAAQLYRAAAKRLHPDQGGSAELFHKLEEARRVLTD